MSGENNIIFDTSALIEFFLGSKSGEEVKDLFIDENTSNFIPALVMAELTSKLMRAGKNPEKFTNVLEQNSTTLDLDLSTAKKAGELHSILKKKNNEISLADCVIMMHGKNENGMIVTKDSHFKHYEKAKILE